MKAEAVRNELLDSLYHILDLEAFSTLDDFLQGETLLLRELALRREPVCPSDLSDQVHLSRPRITAALSALRRKGLVRTEPSQEAAGGGDHPSRRPFPHRGKAGTAQRLF